MPFAAALKFRQGAFSRYYNPGDFDLKIDDFCLVKDEDLGLERVGFVSNIEGRAPIQMRHLPKVLRLATDRESETWYDLRIREVEMANTIRERAGAHKLSIKISEVTYLDEKRQVMVHFTADARVDFRELVKDLAGRFKARIEMWQVGARKESARRGGMGLCGCQLCCSSWLKDFPSISMRFAKDQDIVQPPSKLSGACGRLRCCLRFEHEQYIALASGAPPVGCTGCILGGASGVVVDRNLLKGELTLRAEAGARITVPFSDFTREARPAQKREEPSPPRDKPPRKQHGRRSRKRSDSPRESG